jgi:hypothetical protein
MPFGSRPVTFDESPWLVETFCAIGLRGGVVVVVVLPLEVVDPDAVEPLVVVDPDAAVVVPVAVVLGEFPCVAAPLVVVFGLPCVVFGADEPPCFGALACVVVVTVGAAFGLPCAAGVVLGAPPFGGAAPGPAAIGAAVKDRIATLTERLRSRMGRFLRASEGQAGCQTEPYARY